MNFNCPHCNKEIPASALPEIRTYVRHEGKLKGVQLSAVVQLLSLIFGVGIFVYVYSSVYSTFGSITDSFGALGPLTKYELKSGRMEQVPDGLVVFGTFKNLETQPFMNPQFQINFLDSAGTFIDQCSATSLGRLVPGKEQHLKLKCVRPSGDSAPQYFQQAQIEAATIEKAASFELSLVSATPIGFLAGTDPADSEG